MSVQNPTDDYTPRKRYSKKLNNNNKIQSILPELNAEEKVNPTVLQLMENCTFSAFTAYETNITNLNKESQYYLVLQEMHQTLPVIKENNTVLKNDYYVNQNNYYCKTKVIAACIESVVTVLNNIIKNYNSFDRFDHIYVIEVSKCSKGSGLQLTRHHKEKFLEACNSSDI